MKRTVTALALAICLTITAGLALASSAGPGLTAEQAMEKLKQGNARYISGQAEHPDQDAARRGQTATQGQHPFATVLSCADSRVPVEVLFDQGVGDVFVVRVAGNVAATDELGTIEYGAEHMGVPLLVVLGHTGCGAVTAVAKGEHVTGNLAKLVEPIVPAVKTVRSTYTNLTPEELINKSIVANVWQAVADTFAKSPELRHMAKEGKIKVVGALYHIDSGAVEFLGEHPTQAKLLGE